MPSAFSKIADRGNCFSASIKRAFASSNECDSISGTMERKTCCSSSDGACAKSEADASRKHPIPRSSTMDFTMLRGLALSVLCAAAWCESAWCATSSATAHFGKALQLMHAERYDEAAQELEQTLKDDPSFTEATKSLAICRFQLRSYDTARTLFAQLENLPKFQREAV